MFENEILLYVTSANDGIYMTCYQGFFLPVGMLEIRFPIHPHKKILSMKIDDPKVSIQV